MAGLRSLWRQVRIWHAINGFGPWLAAGAALLVIISLGAAVLRPVRTGVTVSGTVISTGVLVTETGNQPRAAVRLEDGRIVNLPMDSGDACRAGQTAQLTLLGSSYLALKCRRPPSGGPSNLAGSRPS